MCNGVGEVENVPTNQKPGQLCLLMDRPEKHRLIGRDPCVIAFCEVLLKSMQRCWTSSRKCASQSEARVAMFVTDRPEKHKLGRGS